MNLVNALWYLGRGTGLVALLMFTLTMVLGITTRSGRQALGLSRFGVADLHKTASLTGTGEQNHAHRFVAPRLVDCVDCRVHHGVVDCVALLRSRQLQGEHAGVQADVRKSVSPRQDGFTANRNSS